MRVLRGVLALVMVAGAGVLASGHSAAAEPATRIMIVGSSTSHGSTGDYTWRYRLWKRLTTSGVAVDFVGPSSRLYDPAAAEAQGRFVESDAYADPAFDRDHNARWGRALGTLSGHYIGAKDTIQADVTAHQPNYVIVMLGLNDLHWDSSRTAAQVSADMSAFVANARAARPDVRLLVVGIQPTRTAANDPALGARVAEVNQRYQALAAAESTASSPVAYVPPPAGYQPDYNQPVHDSYDGTHPNAHGEIKIADAVGQVLAARFGVGSPHPGVNTGPVLPFQLTCVPGDGEATLTWTESPGATGYWYQRRIVGQPWEPAVYQLKITDSPLRNVWLLNGVTYEYRLQAAKWYDKGVYSNVCSVTPHA